LLLMCYFIFLLQKLEAQKFYAGINAGYNFGIASQNLSSNVNTTAGQTSNAVVKGSFGNGLNAGCFGGYWLNSNIGFELQASYTLSRDFKANYVNEGIYTQKTDLTATMLKVLPCIIITVGDKKIRPYVKMGMAFRVAGNITSTVNYYDVQLASTTITETKYTKGFSLGMFSALGASKKLNEKFTFFMEALINVQSWAPNNGDITKYTINGVDMTSNLNVNQRNIQFNNSYVFDKSAYTQWKPRQELKQYQPFSSIGINVGVYYSFIKKK